MSHHRNINELLFHCASDKSDDGQLFEIYKIFVEMTDRISARRQIANSFFLTINIAVLTAFMHFQSVSDMKHLWFLNIAGIMISYMWICYIQSLKKLNGAKFDIIHLIEKKLVASAYTAEWAILLRPKNGYKRLSDIEIYVPCVFILINIIIFILTTL